ncbi:MAG: chemotaxis-specific protein-glutamate methyltransferase CheB [Roseburia sp.]|nr:chemotaxis-specific protein-glutamate methyltransferase CheB [Ruminococcus sp.]MCM1155922.1 chemotaxis-specific protein-glutamate methyltransferase CheB [Roseburia sp.]MCM1243762.1 chemotaxis-specific protein-glutamate methyltransferase CheB [Roseburia sp.]
MKNILVVDDSALMRRVLCDIIDSDERFHVQDRATNGLEALDLLTKKTYDAVILDVNMPRMNGLELLKELRKQKISARIMMVSTDTSEGAKTTLDALELGALDFVHKPGTAMDCRTDAFKETLLRTLSAVVDSRLQAFSKPSFTRESLRPERKVVELVGRRSAAVPGNKIVALASSTGGPKALQSVIPKLPKNLKAPVVIVQHMPVGFTASLAERLDSLSEVHVKEAAEGDVLEAGVVYISKGGKHLNVVGDGSKYTIHYSDEPSREGVKPCANYMYESLRESRFDQIVCVVMTGMGADGTKGITNLKEKKKLHVIAQEAESCAVYGMPRSIVNAGLADQIVPLEQIAQEIIMNVGVR